MIGVGVFSLLMTEVGLLFVCLQFKHRTVGAARMETITAAPLFIHLVLR